MFWIDKNFESSKIIIFIKKWRPHKVASRERVKSREGSFWLVGSAVAVAHAGHMLKGDISVVNPWRVARRRRDLFWVKTSSRSILLSATAEPILELSMIFFIIQNYVVLVNGLPS